MGLDEDILKRIAEDKALGMPDEAIASAYSLAPAALKKQLNGERLSGMVEGERQRLRVTLAVAAQRELLHIDTAMGVIVRVVQDETHPKQLETAKWLIQRHVAPTVTSEASLNVRHTLDATLQADINHGLELVRDIETIRITAGDPADDPHLLEGEAACPRAEGHEHAL